MHDALLLSSKRCSVVPASCAVCAYTNTPTRRPGCRTSAIDLWAFGFLLCSMCFLSTLVFHCCRLKIPPSPICLFLKSPFVLCDILFYASVWVIYWGLTYLILRNCIAVFNDPAIGRPTRDRDTRTIVMVRLFGAKSLWRFWGVACPNPLGINSLPVWTPVLKYTDAELHTHSHTRPHTHSYGLYSIPKRRRFLWVII